MTSSNKNAIQSQWTEWHKTKLNYEIIIILLDQVFDQFYSLNLANGI